jgi:hypothetical protein
VLPPGPGDRVRSPDLDECTGRGVSPFVRFAPGALTRGGTNEGAPIVRSHKLRGQDHPDHGFPPARVVERLEVERLQERPKLIAVNPSAAGLYGRMEPGYLLAVACPTPNLGSGANMTSRVGGRNRSPSATSVLAFGPTESIQRGWGTTVDRLSMRLAWATASTGGP